MKKFIIFLISLFIGTIADLCLIRVMDSLARHGQISWRDEIYPSKFVLFVVSIYAFDYLSKKLQGIDHGIIIALIKLNPIKTLLLSFTTALVIWQFWGMNFIQVLLRPLKILLFVW